MVVKSIKSKSNRGKFSGKIFVFILIIFISFFNLNPAISKQNDCWQGKIEIKNGVTYILNPEIPIKINHQIKFEKDLQIGLEEGDENYVFGSIFDIDVDGEGNIYVLDNPNFHIKKFSSTGKFICSFGRKGGGPGEFKFPLDFIVNNDSIIMVLDPPNHRFTLFNLDGNYLADFKLINLFPIVPKNLKSKSAHHAFIKYIGFSNDRKYMVTDFKKINIEKKEFNDLFKIERKSPPRDFFSLSSIGKYNPIKYDYANTWCVDSKGKIYLAEKRFDYFIKIYSPEGKLMKCIKRKFEILKLSKDEIDELAKKYDEQSSRFFGRKFGKNAVTKIHEVIQDMFIDDFDRLWVRTSKKGCTDKIVFNIFDVEGRYLKEAILDSDGSSKFLIRNKFLYFKKVDEIGVHYVKRYRIIESK